MKKIDFIYVEAGGGHKSAATALKAVIEQIGKPWQVRLINLNHILYPIDVIKKLTGISMEDAYNLVLNKGWTLGAKQLMQPMHWLIRMYHKEQVELLRRFWQADPPHMVVSLIPHFNRALHQGFLQANPRGAFVTIMTDMADIGPHVWLERQEQYVITGTRLAQQQAYLYDHPPERVFLVSGMILRPTFYNVPAIDRKAEREKLGLHADLPTALVLFGGEGSLAIVDIARRLSTLPLQLILMYGRNEALGKRLRELQLPIGRHIQGFTSEVPKFMQMADFMIGKPGPGSISEALAMKLPVIVDCNAWTLPQERYNAQWLLERGLGLVVENWSEIGAAVEKLLAPGKLDQFRKRAGDLQNRAVFEIPEILEQILERSDATGPTGSPGPSGTTSSRHQ